MMNHPIPAIYEYGVLRPLVALDRLPEHTQVQIIIVPLPANNVEHNPSVMRATDDKPTMAEMLACLREINKQSPIDFELPLREDRPNPLLEMPDELCV
jgi:predicted DNA-binding antitoxin AbrB/MazE fold protein